MGKNKDFTAESNPTMSFIREEGKTKTGGKKTEPKATKPKQKKTTATAKAPEGYKPNPEYIETKSKRVQLLVQPSVYEAVKAKAKAEELSTNEAINIALREYTER